MPRAEVTPLKIRTMRLDRKLATCPKCGGDCKRANLAHRWLRELGLSQPVILEVTYSKHWCPKCERKFDIPMDHLARPGCNFTNRVVNTALDLIDKGKSIDEAADVLEKRYLVHVPKTTINDWVAVERG